MRLVLQFAPVLLLAVAFPASGGRGPEADAPAPFAVDDYFRLVHIDDVALSPDGSTVLFTTSRDDWQSDTVVRRSYLQPTKGGEPVPLDLPAGAGAVAWHPSGTAFTYLAGSGADRQLHRRMIATGVDEIVTHAPRGVSRYAYAPDGKALALVLRPEKIIKSLKAVLEESPVGVLVDVESADILGLAGRADRSDETELRITLAGRIERVLTLPGHIADFRWSDRSDQLLVSFLDPRLAPPGEPGFLNAMRSIGVVDQPSGTFRTLLAASREGGVPTWFAAAAWIPGRSQIVFRRIEARQRLIDLNFSAWGLISTAPGAPPVPRMKGTSEFYRDRLIPLSGNAILIETVRAAHPGLYRLGAQLTEAPELAALQMGKSRFSFSRDRRRYAFVGQGQGRPPEIYVGGPGRAPQPLTAINGDLARRTMPLVREVHWTSVDGVPVQGWLLLPHGVKPAEGWPLLTYVNGGPGPPAADSFAGQNWPQPLEAYAGIGIAVLIPNYRGMGSFGRAYQAPTKVDGEPVDDVTRGVEAMIAHGIADRARLAIAGHSHGAWLGPLVMGRSKLFRACAFAEGFSNMVQLYLNQSQAINRMVHDQSVGVSLFDDPARYIALSPDLDFKGLDAACLFEAGARSAPDQMFGFAKAANHAGMPNLFYVYPRTGHNVDSPRIEREIATRNLDWISYWLIGRGSADPATVAQYADWHRLRVNR